VLEGEFALSLEDVPAHAVAELWTSVRRAHDAWLDGSSRKSA